MGIIGSYQALETLKIIMGVGEPLEGKILMIDAMTSQTNTFKFSKVKGCKVCS